LWQFIVKMDKQLNKEKWEDVVFVMKKFTLNG
jgi:hypothetical protein